MERRQTMEEKEEEEAEDREYFECIMEEIQRKPSVAKEMPQPIIVKYHDILDRLWGWHKLLPMGESVSWADYSAYLKGYLSHNSDAIRSITALAQTCLDSEEKLVSEWNIKAGSEETWSMRKSNILSCLIHECVRSFIDAGCSFSDVSGAALLCIAKEADLTRELLKRGVDPVDDYLIDQGKEIRMCALGLMNCTLDKNSVAASALMLGMAKEAETMIAWIIKNDKPIDLFHYSISDEIEDSRIVRYRTLNVMIDILEESSSAAACHKIDKKEPASRNGPVGDGDGFAAHGAANSTGGSISDVLNSQYKKNMEGGKMSKKRKMKEEGHLDNVWGWERLLPLCGSVKSSGHSSYLEEYYIRNADEFFAAAAANQNPEDSQITTNADKGAAVAKFCLKMEEVLLSEWNTQVERSLDDTLPLSTIIQSSLIKELALSICSIGGDLSIVAFVCITKEADLMCELLKHGAKPFDYMIQQSSMIRTCALGLANLKRNQSTVPAAAMVGMANEAKMMCDWMKREKKLVTFGSGKPNDELEACRLIRVKALDVMTSILQESYFPSSKVNAK